jgi:cysteinyl-tRNA synthetase, unknown class
MRATAFPKSHPLKQQSRKQRILSAAALALLILVVGGLQPAFAQTSAVDAATIPARALAVAKSWGYQLQKINPDVLAAAPHDVVVIDYSRDGTDARALTADEVRRLKTRPDGGRRIVLAYLSVGEAENYRYYWQSDWETSALTPPWLAEPNKRYRTNFPVRYWHADWQAIVFRGENSYLGRILNAGFDGIYLDRVDVHEEFEKENPAAAEQMIVFIKALAAHARSLKPGFLVVPQNGEELLEDAGYRAVIDGIAKEDLLFGAGRSKHPNSQEQIDDGARHLKLMTRDRKPVFVVEYLDNPQDIATARTRIEEYGFVPHFASRALNTMRIGDLPPVRARPPGKR